MEFKKDLLARRNYRPVFLAAIVLIAGIVAYALFGGRENTVADPVPQSPSKDTIYVMPVQPTPKEGTSREVKAPAAKEKEDVSKEDIESLLRKASDLFE